ncbi:uncharacterized protein LOC142352918 [Convolutriloba macropyga]|uniref:uncharacterized protein LOC142352918 n=1 Tax=Convolutriloba macropyga TaxID=536237 RepID=UPI003F525AD1
MGSVILELTSLFRFCIATLKELDKNEWLNSTDVLVRFSSKSSNDVVSSFFVQRDLTYMNGNFSATDDEAIQWQFLSPTLGIQGGINKDEIGLTIFPELFDPTVTTANAHFIWGALQYTGGSSSVYSRVGAGATIGSGEAAAPQINIAPNETYVVIYYVAASNGRVCGIEFSSGGSVGCNTHGQTHNVDPGYSFAGFVTLTSQNFFNAIQYRLLPLQTRPAVIPATPTNVETDDVANLTGVAYYVNENSDSSKFTFSLSSPATEIRIVTYILDSRNESTGEAKFTEYMHNATVSETTFEIDLLEYNGEKLDRPCTMILGNLFTDAPDCNYSQFTAFTGGYTIDSAENFSWPENFVEDGNETVYTTLPRHSVIEGLATVGEVCDLDFIGETYSVGMKEGVLIADGVWLGPDQGQTDSIQFDPGQFVSRVSCRANLIILFC